VAKYGRHPKRFAVWCGIDYTGFDQPGFGPAAVAELERCHKAGAAGVGELSDKGRGFGATTNSPGMHIDDSRMDPVLEKCAELRMPVNIHVGEDKWMYERMDQTNDGLMNASKWRVANAPGVLQHDEVVDTLERAVKKHPRTIFIACHTSVPGSGRYRFTGTRDEAGSYAMVYAPVGRPFKVRLDAIQGEKVKAWWFNPRTGEATVIGTHANKGEREFTPPDKGEMLDWVLVLDDASKKYPVPGVLKR